MSCVSGQSRPQWPHPWRAAGRDRAGDPPDHTAVPRDPLGQSRRTGERRHDGAATRPSSHPMAALVGDASSRAVPHRSGRPGRCSIRSSGRLEENRELVRYLAGLLVFLGLLGTFWGLIDTVNSVGRIIGSLRTGAEAAVLFDELKSSLAAHLSPEWACPFRPLCSGSQGRWFSASSISRPDRRRTGSTRSSRIGSR